MITSIVYGNRAIYTDGTDERTNFPSTMCNNIMADTVLKGSRVTIIAKYIY